MLIIHALAWTLIATLLYVACFLREDEEGRLQDRLTVLWLQIDKIQNAAIARHTAFLRVVAATTAELLDDIFGGRLFSWRAFGASACLSLSSLLFLHEFMQPPWVYHWWSFRLTTLAMNAHVFWPLDAIRWPLLTLLGLLVAIALPARWVKVSALPAVVAAGFVLSTISLRADVPISLLWHAPGAFLNATAFATVVLGGGIMCDFVFVALARKVLRYAQNATPVRIIVSLIALLLAAYAVTVGPASFFPAHEVTAEFNVNILGRVSSHLNCNTDEL